MSLNWRPFVLALAAVLSLLSLAIAERGTDGQLRMLYWQAPSILNPFLSGGTKDIHAASLVLEPLARYDENGGMVPALAAEIPTVENGGISADLLSVTWTLRDDVVWSDGTPFTAADVVFTAAYCMDPEGACSGASRFQDVEAVEAVGPPPGAYYLQGSDAVSVRSVRGLGFSSHPGKAVRSVYGGPGAGLRR